MATRDDPRADRRDLLRRAYASFNGQDLEGLLELVSDDVDWPDDHGGRLHGKSAVRAHWTGRWTHTRTHDEPVGFRETDDGRIAVEVSQTVRALDGAVISTGEFTQVYDVRANAIARMDIEPG